MLFIFSALDSALQGVNFCHVYNLWLCGGGQRRVPLLSVHPVAHTCATRKKWRASPLLVDTEKLSGYEHVQPLASQGDL